MTIQSLCDKFIDNALYGTAGFDYSDVESLNGTERQRCLLELVDACEADVNMIIKILPQVVCLIPLVSQEHRYHCVYRIIHLLNQHPQVGTRDVYNVLDYAVVKSLLPLDIIGLAGELSAGMASPQRAVREGCAWALIRIIPYLHPINQKEFAHDVFLLHQDSSFKVMLLDGLCALIYCMDQYSRSDMTFFFAEELKRNESLEAKFFVLDLLKRVTPVLTESDRVRLADGVAPLLFYTDAMLVRKSIGYFADAISLLPQGERYHFTQLVAGLINDMAVRSEVVAAIEKAVPYLTGEGEKMQLMELMQQFDSAGYEKRHETKASWEFVFEQAKLEEGS